MQPSLSVPQPPKSKWVYVSLAVRDADRLLKPTHVSFERLLFSDAPHLVSNEVEIIVTNGDVEDHHMAAVFPHDPNATEIPIRLLPHGDDARL